MTGPEETALRKPSFWRRKTLWINLALIVGILVVLALIVGTLRPKAADAPARTATVERGDVISTVTASGTVEAAEPLELSFVTPGVVTAVDVASGDTVTAGQVLARIDDTAARQQVASARLGLAQARDTIDSSGANQTSAATAVANARSALASAQRTQKSGNDKFDEAVVQAKANLTDARALWSTQSSLHDLPTTKPSRSPQQIFRATRRLSIRHQCKSTRRAYFKRRRATTPEARLPHVFPRAEVC